MCKERYQGTSLIYTVKTHSPSNDSVCTSCGVYDIIFFYYYRLFVTLVSCSRIHIIVRFFFCISRVLSKYKFVMELEKKYHYYCSVHFISGRFKKKLQPKLLLFFSLFFCMLICGLSLSLYHPNIFTARQSQNPEFKINEGIKKNHQPNNLQTELRK